MAPDTSSSFCDSDTIDLESSTKIEFESNISTIKKNHSSYSLKHQEVVHQFSEQDEKKLVRKLDYRIMPLFCLFYFADFLDRANIGNAT